MELLKEYFLFNVQISDSPYGKMAKWENNKHPENPNFMQVVNWCVTENKSQNIAIVRYYLDKTCSYKNHIVCALPIVGTFEDTVFNYWKC